MRHCICPPNGAEAVPQVWDKDWGSSGKPNKSRLRETFVELWVWFKPIASRLHTNVCTFHLSLANGNTAVDIGRATSPVLKPDDGVSRCVGQDTSPHRVPHLAGTETTAFPDSRAAAGTWCHFSFYRKMYKWGLWTKPCISCSGEPLTDFSSILLRATEEHGSLSWVMLDRQLPREISVKGFFLFSSVTAEKCNTACVWIRCFLFLNNKPLKSV